MFCKIISKEIPAEIVYEDKNTLALLDINPASPGHTLVLPKEHYNDFASTPSEVVCKTVKVAQKIAPKIIKAVGATDFNLITNNGPIAGQSIEHLHFHIIPRGTNFPKPSWVTIEYGKDEIQQIAKKIRG